MISDRRESSTTSWLVRQSLVFKEAFAWLRAMPSTQVDGRIDLRGDRLYMLVQGYETQTAEKGRWESHRRTIAAWDAQATLAEKLGASLLIFATLAVGLYPKLLFDRIMPAVETMRFLQR